jgi:hypothetical protein
VTEEGIATEVKALHLKKSWLLSEVSEFGNAMVTKGHSPKAFSPIEVTEEGMIKDERLRQ